MSSKGWGFRKVGAAFPYFLFLVSFSLGGLRGLKKIPAAFRNRDFYIFRVEG
jgi:hypothetical protein